MPVEIREIVVKAQIEDSSPKSQKGFGEEELDQLKEEIIEECVDRINQGFKLQQDR